MASPPAQPPGFAAPPDGRPLHFVIRWTLTVTAVFLLALGIDLTLAPARTEEFFSWTIKSPLTAATIGAFYVTGFFLLVMALQGSRWARARTVILAGVVFSALALLATLLDLDKFHFGSPEPFAVVVAWVWISTYVGIPALLLVGLIPQRRVPGDDARTGPPPRWVSAALAGTGALMVVVAAGLTVAPEVMARIWPWTLTPLTARVLGAWTAGFGLVSLWAAGENDRFRMVPAAATLAVGGLAHLLTVLRFRDQLDWDGLGAWIYVAVLAAGLVAGGLAWARLRQPAPT